MNGWREDVKIISELLTGEYNNSWRRDFISISGGTSPKWREAVRLWAASYGVQSASWRECIIGIALTLIPAIPPSNWREALRYIRLYYEGNPPQLFGLIDLDGYSLIDSDGYRLVVRN